MKFLFAAVALLAIAQAQANLDLTQWKLFKSVHGKTYETTQEEQHRLGVFQENLKKIAEHNEKYKQGLVTFEQAVNKYADLEHHEFVKTLNGFKGHPIERMMARKGFTYIPPANVEVPAAVDWRTSGAVTPVKDQGQCGSCWSFSATGSLEGQHFRKTGSMVSLSEQNLVDCSGSYGNNGCNGGLMDFAFEYIRDNNGVDTESSYPYEARDGRCRFQRSNVGATDSGYVDISSGSESQLQNAVATVGPIAVAMDAGHQSFQFYSSGVYYEPACSSTFLDHGVLAVGYGSQGGQDYWIIKNSWGPGWGNSGFFNLARNRNNHCGVATQASYPLV